MVYITTSRKPSLATRRLAKQLARVLRAESENRGKRGVEETIDRAETKGHSRCLLVYEKNGNPDRLCFLERGKWLPCILLKGTGFVEEEKSRLPGLAKIIAEDEAGKEIAELFSESLNEELEEGVEMRASASEISFSFLGKRAGPELKVRGIEEPKKTELEKQG